MTQDDTITGQGGDGGAPAIRVLLVDDQQLVRTGFRLLLETEPGIEVVGEAEDGRAGVERVRELSPDVVCMDLQMPVLDGVAATAEITADPALAASRVLVLTTFRDDESVRRALAAGASGFLVKNAPPETLVEAIRVIHAGEALLDPAVTRSVIAAMRDDPRAAAERSVDPASLGGVSGRTEPSATVAREPIASPPDVLSAAGAGSVEAGGAARSAVPRPEPAELQRLSEREREVLLGLAEGLSNADIAKRLWVSDATVKTHVSNVLAKLGLRDRIQAVIYAYEHGFVTPHGE